MQNRGFILWFDDIRKEDVSLVGGKCANLGELSQLNIPTLPGFAVTADAYSFFIEKSGLKNFIERTLAGLDTNNLKDLSRRGKAIRKAIVKSRIPWELEREIRRSYVHLGDIVGLRNPYVAVRSSATAEDLPGASFAGQQDTYLNVRGEDEVVLSVKKCFASLFTDRAISYREDKGFDHFRVKLSVGVQKMGRSDTGASGVMFTLDPDSGFRNVVVINSSYGLGEYIVQGKVTPDRFVIFKPTLGIIEKRLGAKNVKLVRSKKGNVEAKVSEEDASRFSLTDGQAKKLAEYGLAIEKHYRKPMDIEWLLDGDNGRIYIVQARPETVHSLSQTNEIERYVLMEEGNLLLEGEAVGRKIGAGRANVIESIDKIHRFREGDVLVTDMTDPDWEPVMKKASAIVTNRGGTTSHAAIVSRELGVPCVIGTGKATSVLKTGTSITVDCSTGRGRIYEGLLKYEIKKRDIGKLPKTRTKVMVNIGDPNEAFEVSRLPVAGVGLARQEFIITSSVKAHPLYLLKIGRHEKYVKTLSEGIGKIAAAFYPRPVIVRLSDFKSDEYANLAGGREFEPVEDNPMIGWRGASRYYDNAFSSAFHLEIKALKRVVRDMGLDNIIVMVPFCRTPEEGRKVIREMLSHGFDRKRVKVYVMAEIPSNIFLAEEFADIFDGFSIGSNDLTQLVLGLDRNSRKLSYLFDERNEAVRRAIAVLIKKAHSHKPRRPVGICGEAPSNHPDFVRFLVEQGIDSISVNPDVALDTVLLVSKIEKSLAKKRGKSGHK